MFNNLQALGLGLVTFAITIGIGTVILIKFGDAVAVCPNYNETAGTGAYNITAQECWVNQTTHSAPTNTGWATTNYMNTQLGTTGLAGWTPAIIALAVGMLFLGALFVGLGRGRTY